MHIVIGAALVAVGWALLSQQEKEQAKQTGRKPRAVPPFVSFLLLRKITKRIRKL